MDLYVKITHKISIGQMDWAKKSRSNRRLVNSLLIRLVDPKGGTNSIVGPHKVTDSGFRSPNTVRGTHSDRIGLAIGPTKSQPHSI